MTSLEDVPSVNPALVLIQHISIDTDSLRSLKHIQHSAPILRTCIPPRVISPSLNSNVSSLQDPRFTRVKHQLNLALQHNAKIARDSPMHGDVYPGAKSTARQTVPPGMVMAGAFERYEE